MSLHSSLSPQAQFKRSQRDQTSGPALPLRDQINAAYTARMVRVRQLKTSRKPSDVQECKRLSAYMADLAEQLVILDAIEMGYIHPVEPEPEPDRLQWAMAIKRQQEGL